jgi:2-polyprenyl-3-methyl-5-hydroxy-6-metoxy-1,4-benzoquinol methylase
MQNEVTYTKVVDLKRLEFIRQTLASSIPEKGKVLDVGCGNGIISMNLGNWGYDVLGIDVSDKAIENARTKNKLPNVKFMVKSAEELIAEGPQYDAIICSEVLEHLHQPSALVKTIRVALKETGIFIVTVPNGKGPRESLVTKPILRMRAKNNWAWRFILRVKKALGYGGTTVQSAADNLDHVQFFSRKDLTRLLEENHFVNTKFSNTNFVDDVFPFSFFANRITFLQKLDCKLADYLPYRLTGGFNTVWKKQIS